MVACGPVRLLFEEVGRAGVADSTRVIEVNIDVALGSEVKSKGAVRSRDAAKQNDC